ncbi:MAG: proline--tRNA ligase [Alphaproteobacteria bacterium]|nr:proline--tRNA ligase [Candidatus Fonsibacter sp. PEL55]
MLISKLFFPVLREVSADAKLKSHQLMLKAGMIRQSAAGIYSWLPLGFKVLKKIEQVVREEQDNVGAQEMLMPTIQSADIWKESGRYDDYGQEMLRIKDRSERELLYGPTNEELITEIFRDNVKSYKSLPLILYHIQWKFRDEIRPRFGVMRCREFLMKDSYSFDLTKEDAIKSYNKMFYAYLRTFTRLELKALPLRASSGPIGGDASHEFIILADTGESQVYLDKSLLDIDVNSFDSSEASINKMISAFSTPYSATDEKHSEKEFNEKVLKPNQLVTKGIEVGHIFYFGNKYSLSRLVAAVIEAKCIEGVMKWPFVISPFDIAVIPLNNKSDSAPLDKARKIYETLLSNSIDAILDDTLESPSSKFKNFDLIGVPYQIIVGSKSNNDKLEFKELNAKTEMLTIEEIIKKIKKLKG